jgi:hypothetical protein
MTGNRKRIIYLLSGLGAGLIAFAAIELFAAAGLTSYLALSLAQGAALGLIFGFIFGFADGLLYKELKSGLIKAGIAAGIGALTAAAAQLLASQGMLWTAGIFKLEHNQTMGIIFPLWRGIGWMLMGAAIGAVDGIHQKTLRRTIAGILGGLTGGLLGGLSFEFIVRYLPEAAFAGAAGLGLMGVLTGLFISEFERRFSYARLLVLNGQLKDREYLLVKHKLRIGSDFRDDIYLHGYKELSTVLISSDKSDIYLEAATANRVLLNDRAVVEKQPMKYQDVIQAGDIKLLYMPL